MSMKYCIYRFSFNTAVHFGSGSLDDSEYSFHADTLFSALCGEALKISLQSLNEFVEDAKNKRFCFSDALPFIGDEYYLPKPIKEIEHGDERADSVKKKAFKKLRYIPVSGFDVYVKGEMSPDIVNRSFESFGKHTTKTSVSLRGEKESEPYRVGTFEYSDTAGLYVIAGYEDEENGIKLGELIEALSYSGIGGKKNSGLGRFSVKRCQLTEDMEKHLTGDYSEYMTLSVSLPGDDELADVVEKSDYVLIKKSGFVDSAGYSDTQMRKRDLYVFDAGACIRMKYDGGIFDVSDGGSHPVYRYAVPMFWGIS